jgi:sulfur carrier protein
MTEVILNGAVTRLPDPATLVAAVATITNADTGCAVAVNDEVVPRGEWRGRELHSGDRVEVLTAVQGG